MVIGLILLMFFFSACHPAVREKPEKTLLPLKPGDYPWFTDHSGYQGLAASIDQSLIYFRKVPPDRAYVFDQETVTAAHQIRTLETFKTFLETHPPASELNAFIRSRFKVYQAAGNDSREVLFTGYYEPVYEGRPDPEDPYVWPLYSRPDDLLEIDLSAFSEQYKGHKRLVARLDPARKRVVPYYSREEIRALPEFHTRAVPVAWLKSPIDAFFLEIQGSGRIDLGNGDILRVHYAAANGRPYRAVGKYLMDLNEISKEAMSMQAIRDWLERNPDRMDEVLNYNPSHVFFKTETDGPFGSLGVKVGAFRSIATDSRLFPKGSLGFIHTDLPDQKGVSLFVLNQDTGGAIKGPARADLFCGSGEYAELTAGHLKHYGRMFFLVLKPDGE